MRVRDAVLENTLTLSDSGVKTIDLDIVDPISAIDLEFRGTNGATSNKGNFLTDVITKVEVVDGSEVMYSLSGSQLQALHFFKTGHLPSFYCGEWASGSQRAKMPILFGRRLYDRAFAFSPTRLKNPQLRITTNIAAIRAAGATGFVSGSITVTAVAKVMEELGAAPPNYLMAKGFGSFTAASSGEKRIELPTDYAYRMMMMQAYEQGSDIDEIISTIKITADTDAFVAFNRDVKQFDAEMEGLFGEAYLYHDVFGSHNEETRHIINKEPRVSLQPHVDDTVYLARAMEAWSSRFYWDLFDSANATYSTDIQAKATIFGHAPHSCLPIPLGVMEEPDSWFDPRKYRKLEAVLTQANADGTVEMVGEQVRPH